MIKFPECMKKSPFFYSIKIFGQSNSASHILKPNSHLLLKEDRDNI
jgi:hypothetical protein